jgi:hypothetical protein
LSPWRQGCSNFFFFWNRHLMKLSASLIGQYWNEEWSGWGQGKSKSELVKIVCVSGASICHYAVIISGNISDMWIAYSLSRWGNYFLIERIGCESPCLGCG